MVRGVIRVSARTTIRRPVDEVFAYVADVTNDPAWHTDVREARSRDGGPPGLGSVFDVRTRPFLGRSTGSVEIVGFEPPRLLELSAELSGMRAILGYRLEEVEGGTALTRQVDMGPPGVMRLLQPVLRLVISRGNARFVDNLRRTLEG